MKNLGRQKYTAETFEVDKITKDFRIQTYMKDWEQMI